jgi:hypothetical protein
MAADQLWTDARAYMFLADAQENVFTDLSPIAPHAFVGSPVQLTTSDSGVTYTFPSYPMGHVEVYAQETGGRQLFATTYGNAGGDFVIEGITLRTPGNRTRTYTTGPWARFTRIPARIAANQEPSLEPDAARELILWKALENAAEVSNGAMDPTPWAVKYQQARTRWITVWRTQHAHGGAGSGTWWLGLDAMNGAE